MSVVTEINISIYDALNKTNIVNNVNNIGDTKNVSNYLELQKFEREQTDREHVLQNRVEDKLRAMIVLQREQAKGQSILDASYQDPNSAFYLVDISAIKQKHQEFITLLPRVKPHYAVKCNPHQKVLEILYGLGAAFDCASRGEIEQVLALGAKPSDIIFANPCKPESHIKYASACNVARMTFDNLDELVKIKLHYAQDKKPEVVLRILTDDTFSLCKLGLKFGAQPKNWRMLLESAKRIGLNVAGVSFHVGSGCFNEDAFGSAVRAAHEAMQIALDLGHDCTLLDIGGGFPGKDNASISFSSICNVLNKAIDECFYQEKVIDGVENLQLKSEFANLEIIAEPGRYYVNSAFTLAVNVIAKRNIARESGLVDANDNINNNYLKATSQLQHASINSINSIATDSDDNDASSEGESAATEAAHSSRCASYRLCPNNNDSEFEYNSSDNGSDHEGGRRSNHGATSVTDELDQHKQPVDRMYYVNDGVYGSFNSIVFDHQEVFAEYLCDAHGNKLKNSSSPSCTVASIWGPTCDSFDCINKLVTHLPDLQVGDWLMFQNMGAYTTAAASTFNGFAKPSIHFVETV